MSQLRVGPVGNANLPSTQDVDRSNAQVGEYSVNPRLVAASETWLQTVNPQFREPSCQFWSCSLVQSISGMVKPTVVSSLCADRQLAGLLAVLLANHLH